METTETDGLILPPQDREAERELLKLLFHWPLGTFLTREERQEIFSSLREDDFYGELHRGLFCEAKALLELEICKPGVPASLTDDADTASLRYGDQVKRIKVTSLQRRIITKAAEIMALTSELANV